MIRRGGIPFVLGGSSEQCVCVAAGLMSVMGGGIGIVNINSQLDVRPSNVSANVFLPICAHGCLCACVRVHVCVSTHVCVYVGVCACVCVYRCRYICVCTCRYAYMCVYAAWL